MNKLHYNLLLDIFIILIPIVLIPIAPDVVLYFSYLLIGLSVLSSIGVLSDEAVQNVLAGRIGQPSWWPTYDVVSDLVFISVWAYYGFYGLVATYIFTKLFSMMMISKYKESM